MDNRYELTITPNYVSDWELNDAIRELIQNGIDQEAVCPDNKFTILYDAINAKLFIKNKDASLSIKSLLLGRTTKATNGNTIGKFGEGYKIAALVLNRLGKTFTVYNGACDEIWTSQFEESKKWQDKVLVFTINNTKFNMNDLIIEVGDVSTDEYNDMLDIWLGFDKLHTKIDTSFGEILTDDAHKDTTYVNGIKIGHTGKLEYGYNFKPEHIKLERDRKTCEGWNAKITTSKMLREAMLNGDIDKDKIIEMINNDCDDTYQMDIIDNKEIKSVLLESFDKSNPSGSVPVSSQEEVVRVKALGGNPVVVHTRVASIIRDETEKRIDELVTCAQQDDSLTLSDKFNMWLDMYRSSIPDRAIDELEKLIEHIVE